MFWRRRAEERERSLERDIEHHLALETDENIARGMRPEEARYAALRKFGNAGRVREDARAAWTWVWLDTLGGDVRHALRRMARSPGTAALAVVSLALALAPNLTLFSVMDRLLLTPAPVARPETLREIRLRETTPGSERRSVNLSYPEFLDLQRTLKTFQGVAFQRKQGAFVAVNGRRTLTFANLVSDGYFTLLGLTLHLGPGLTTDRPGVVVSHSFWMRTLEGRADAIGRTLLVSGQPFSIQGVAMAGFQGMDGVPPADLWIGIERWMEAHPAFRPMIERRDNRDGTVWARLEPGSGEARAAAEVESVYREMPVTAGAPLAPWIYDRLAERRLGNRNIAFIGVSLLGLVLAVACANVSGVLLARAEERRHETAIRQSLGAPRGRLIREWMVESAALSAIAAAVGLAASRLLIRLLPEAFPSLPVPLTFDFALSARVWWYTGLLAVFSAIAFGAVPAWRASRTDMLSGLRRDLSMRVFHARVPIRSVLIVSQVAVAEVLLFAAGALLHSLSAAERMDPGFDTRRTVALAMALAHSE
ncbi:MAG TPA: hypothetical protein DEH78_07370, partial [Solibacterales bacterium]|nr:hypothetical protein [Bryobacterales bacterium]